MQLPEVMLRRARFLATGQGEPWDPPAPRDAATVVLLRDSTEGLEAFMMRRALTMRFAPGMHVFAGGSVDARDRVGDDGLDVDRITASRRAAVREVFEETSVLLEPAQLHPWSRWITPEFEPLRFDVDFYLAALPPGADALDISGEADEVMWIRPEDALHRHRRDDLAMLPPTVETLEDLTGFATVAEALATHRPIRPWLPRMVAIGDDLAWQVIDADTGEVVVDSHLPPASSEALGVQP